MVFTQEQFVLLLQVYVRVGQIEADLQELRDEIQTTRTRELKQMRNPETPLGNFVEQVAGNKQHDVLTMESSEENPKTDFMGAMSQHNKDRLTYRATMKISVSRRYHKVRKRRFDLQISSSYVKTVWGVDRIEMKRCYNREKKSTKYTPRPDLVQTFKSYDSRTGSPEKIVGKRPRDPGRCSKQNRDGVQSEQKEKPKRTMEYFDPLPGYFIEQTVSDDFQKSATPPPKQSRLVRRVPAQRHQDKIRTGKPKKLNRVHTVRFSVSAIRLPGIVDHVWKPGGVSFKKVQWDLLEKVYKHDKVWGLLERFHDTCLVEILKTFSHSAKDAHVDSLNKGIKILFSSKVDLGKLIQREEICFGDKENQKVEPIDTATMKSEESELMFPLIQEVYIILVHFSFGTSCYSGAQEMSESSYIMRDQLDGARNESGLGTEMFEAFNVIPMKRYARKNEFRVYGSTSRHMVTLFVISVARSNGKSDEFSAYSKLPVGEYLGYIEGVIIYGKCSELLWFILSLSVYNFGGSSLDFNNKNHDLDGMKETLKMTTKDGRLSSPQMLDTIILFISFGVYYSN